MVESKNLKLKLGLCGLALTSFLALNARSNTVHADIVDSGNTNAITWDSDQDDSQVVKEDSQQFNASQSVQTQDAVQSFVQTQEAPATQSVQSNAQNRAETSAVRVSNFDTSAVNRLNVDKQRAQAKVANVNATVSNQPVQITNPQNNQVIVHYVKANGESIDDPNVVDQTIDVTKTGNHQYDVPKGYGLANNKGYTNDDNLSKAQVQATVYPPDGRGGVVAGDYDHLVKVGQPLSGKVAYKLADMFHAVTDGNAGVGSVDGLPSESAITLSIYEDDTEWITDIQAMGTDLTFSSRRVSTNDGKGPIVANDITGIDSTEREESTITKQDCADFLNWANSNLGNSLAASPNNLNYVGRATSSDVRLAASYVWPLFMHADKLACRFTDNSGQVKSVTGNHINLAVTKPQNVDPNSAQCKKQATRVIHVAFPNGVKPESYNSIIDSAGNKLTFDSNNNLTQTVIFTRSKTVDSLTGATLIQTPWVQHGAINAVTLPAIPGYTMVTNTK